MIFDTCTLNGRGIDPLKMDADKESLVALPVSWLWRDEGWDLFSPGRITAVGTWLSEPSSQAHDDGNCLFRGGGMNVRHLQIRFRDGSVSALKCDFERAWAFPALLLFLFTRYVLLGWLSP